MERIYEMANRRKRQTGLPINIRIDENGWWTTYSLKGGIYLATFMYRDERVITLYDKYMNGEIK